MKKLTTLRGKNTLESLSYEELDDLQEDFRNEMSYNDIRGKYNLKPYIQLDRNLLKVTQDLKDEILIEDYEWEREKVYYLISRVNSTRQGLVFWDKARDLESVEDLVDYMEYINIDFDTLFEWEIEKEK